MLLLLPLFSLLSLAQSPQAWIEDQIRPHQLEIFDFSETGRGLKTLRDLNEGDTVLTILPSNVLTASGFLQRFPDIMKAAENKANSGKKLTDEQIMALGLIKLKSHHPYVKSLPQNQYSIHTIPDKLKASLPPAYQSLVDATKQYVTHHYNEILEAYIDDTTHDTSLQITKDDFIWAIASVKSRSVTLEDDVDPHPLFTISGGGRKPRAMLPGFDLLNHKTGAQSRLRYDNSKERQQQQHYRLVVHDTYKKGEQVFLTYGDDKDNLQLLFTYGFSIPNNPINVAFFDLDDILRSAHFVLPNIFTDHILNVLKSQTLKEFDRTLFTHSDGAAQGKLLGVLNMVQVLAERLSEISSLDGLDGAILRNLLKTRLETLDRCIQKVRTVEVEDGWQPLRMGIQVLLEEEKKYLQQPVS